MPDIPIAGTGGSPYNPDMEARITRLEDDMSVVKGTVIRIEAMLAATLPHLATKAELLAVLLTAYGLGLASVAVMLK